MQASPSMARSARPGIFGVAAALLLASCGISQQQEVELGASTAAEVSAQLPLIRDATVVNYITTLGNQLAAVTDSRGLAWHFTVVDSREVNAFAVPGGWVYVNRGLIERATNMSELAGVLAHEIGHITRRHSVQQMQQMQGANVGLALMCTLTRVCESGASQAAINIGGSALFATFSRSDEAEADAEGVSTTIKAGISPNGIPSMFQLLLNERKSNPSGLDAFFASHPLEESRITATQAQIATYPASQLQRLTRDTPAFQAFRRRLLALPPSPVAKKAAEATAQWPGMRIALDVALSSRQSATPCVTIPSAWRKPTMVCGHSSSVTSYSLGSTSELAPSPGIRVTHVPGILCYLCPRLLRIA